MQQSAPTSPTAPVDPPRRSVEVIFLKEEPPPPPSVWKRHAVWMVLAGITIFGGLIRFTYLNHPMLWGDEAMVYWRTCGTFDELLDRLRIDGFAPLHYELMWLMGHYLKPTPMVLRFIPALSGTLLIPAMFFLARQFVQRSTALLAAGITAASAFLIFYSRDAKMYGATWLFITLNVACLLWWFRTRRMTAWLCWIACGCAACGFHAESLVPLCLSPVFLLTQKKTNYLQAILLALGLAIILSGPVGYYFKYNQWIRNVQESGWGMSGIDWVEQFQNHDGPGLVRYTATNFLMGWTWPEDEEKSDIPAWLVRWPTIAAEVMAAMLVLALLPWPLQLRRNREEDPPPEPSWRLLLWLGVWIVLPGYIFYCHSIADFASPLDWFHNSIAAIPDKFTTPFVGRPLAGWAVVLFFVALISPGFYFRRTRPAFVRGLQGALVIAIILLACQGIFLACFRLSEEAMLSGQRWHSIWIPRYLGFMWPAIAIAIAALMMRLPTRPVRWIAILFFVAVNLCFGFGRIFGHTEPPVDRMAEDVVAAQPAKSRTLTFMDIETAGAGPSYGTLRSFPGKYYLQMAAWYQPMSPQRLNNILSELTLRDHYSYNDIAAEARNNPRVTEIIQWEEFREIPDTAEDSLLQMLPGWSLRNEKWYPLREYWTWKDVTHFRRRDYVRISGGILPAAAMR